jgi:hypothetical protein
MMKALLVVVLALGYCLPAAADWNRKQRSEFTNDCVGSCQVHPSVPAARRGECGGYCGCIVGEAEKFISESEYTRLTTLAQAGGSDPKLDRFRALFPMCNRRVFGN